MRPGKVIAWLGLTFVLLNLSYGRRFTNEETSYIDSLTEDFSQAVGHQHGIVSVLPTHCWNAAISLLGNPESIKEAETFCSNLPVASQKRLALELVRCHLSDVDRPLFRDAAVNPKCTPSKLADVESIHMCLRNLSDAAERAYSFYVPHIQTLCTRKTQEIFIQYQQQQQQELSKQYADIAVKSMEEIESLQRQSSQFVTDVQQRLSDMPLLVEELISKRIEATLHEQLGEKLQERIRVIVQSQASEQASFFEGIMTNLKDRDIENQQHYQEWAQYHSTMMTLQAKEIERQRESLKHQRRQMEDLTEKVSETSRNMQPLFGLQSFLKTATEGYAWLNLLLYFLATFNVVWVLTRPTQCQRIRPYIFAVVVLESAAEIALAMAVSYELVSDTSRANITFDCRRLAILLECLVYVVGLLASLLVKRPNAADEYEEMPHSFVPGVYHYDDRVAPMHDACAQQESLRHVVVATGQHYGGRRAHDLRADRHHRGEHSRRIGEQPGYLISPGFGYVPTSRGTSSCLEPTIGRAPTTQVLRQTRPSEVNRTYHHNRNDGPVVSPSIRRQEEPTCPIQNDPSQLQTSRLMISQPHEQHIPALPTAPSPPLVVGVTEGPDHAGTPIGVVVSPQNDVGISDDNGTDKKRNADHLLEPKNSSPIKKARNRCAPQIEH